MLRDCAPQQHAKGYRFSDVQAGFLDATLRQQPGWQVQAPPAWRERAARQSGQAKLDCPPLGPLEEVLRPYQRQGVAWLQFLRENMFGGILADEMGLGKTLQTLAFLAAPCHTNRQLSGPALIVCPTSLVFNWLAEAKKFTPGLKVARVARRGPARAVREISRRATSSSPATRSSGATRSGIAGWSSTRWCSTKRSTSRTGRRRTRSRGEGRPRRTPACAHRHADGELGARPLEHLRLPDARLSRLGEDFRERYEQPITRDKDAAAQARLGAAAAPVPPAPAQDARWPRICRRSSNRFRSANSPTTRQEIYQQVLAVSRKEVMDAVGAQGLAKSRMIVLNALLRLRQICCDLRLLKLENAEFTDDSSGKLELFGELLEEAIDGGHRVLVFSQFVSHARRCSRRSSRRRTSSSATSTARPRIAARWWRHSRANARSPSSSSASRPAASA